MAARSKGKVCALVRPAHRDMRRSRGLPYARSHRDGGLFIRRYVPTLKKSGITLRPASLAPAKRKRCFRLRFVLRDDANYERPLHFPILPQRLAGVRPQCILLLLFGGTHIPALLGAVAAYRCTILAVLCLVFGALVRASFADIGAQPADLRCVLAGPAHQLGGQAAYCCAFIVQFNAAGQYLRIRLLQAGCGAGVARLGTLVTSLDARLELILIHGLSP